MNTHGQTRSEHTEDVILNYAEKAHWCERLICKQRINPQEPMCAGNSNNYSSNYVAVQPKRSASWHNAKSKQSNPHIHVSVYLLIMSNQKRLSLRCLNHRAKGGTGATQIIMSSMYIPSY